MHDRGAIVTTRTPRPRSRPCSWQVWPAAVDSNRCWHQLQILNAVSAKQQRRKEPPLKVALGKSVPPPGRAHARWGLDPLEFLVVMRDSRVILVRNLPNHAPEHHQDLVPLPAASASIHNGGPPRGGAAATILLLLLLAPLAEAVACSGLLPRHKRPVQAGQQRVP